MGDYAAWVPVEDEITTAYNGLMLQAEVAGIKVNSSEFAPHKGAFLKFIAHQTNVMATNAAHIRYLYNIMHTPPGKEI